MFASKSESSQIKPILLPQSAPLDLARKAIKTNPLKLCLNYSPFDFSLHFDCPLVAKLNHSTVVEVSNCSASSCQALRGALIVHIIPELAVNPGLATGEAALGLVVSVTKVMSEAGVQKVKSERVIW